jgi:general secretion pathway protein D
MPSRGVVIPDRTVGSLKGGVGLAATVDSISAVLSALRSYGTVKIVSNPTVRARSGEPSVVQVGTNYRYISKVTATTTATNAGPTTSVSAETSTLFSGIMLGLTASVRRDGSIELFVHPMQSALRDGTLALVPVGAGSSVTLPVVDSKSITTTLAVNSGDVVVLGGLADQSVNANNGGVPGLGDVPVVGNLFDQRANGQKSRELVIVMKATLL